MSKEELFKKMSDAILSGDRDETTRLARESLKMGLDAYETLSAGCVKAMGIMSNRYDKGETFAPDILVASDAMYGAIEVLKPHIKVDPAKIPGTIVIGVIEGDVHDIGKNIVKILFDLGGFRVIDLGRNVPMATFIESARENKPDILAASALMTTTMVGLEELVEKTKEAGIRDKLKIMVGGAPLSAEYAEKIGADAYAPNAPQALKVAEGLIRAQKGGG